MLSLRLLTLLPIGFILALSLQSCSTLSAHREPPTLNPPTTITTMPSAKPSVKEQNQRLQIGEASWYGPGFHGKLTSTGEVYNQHSLTAAHRTLPAGSKVRVTNLDNGKSVTVKINDRGPYIKGRILDLSRKAAKALGIVDKGKAEVKIEMLSWSEKPHTNSSN